jgi:hypothetical protein
MSANATYVYCLVAAARRPALDRVPRGLAGTARVRLLDVDRRLWLVVADAPLTRYGAEAINARLSDLDWVAKTAVDHEAVVEAFIGGTAVLPMKLFTIFSSDARAIDHVARDRRRVDAVLKRVSNRVEWGARVVFDRVRAPAGSGGRSKATSRPRPATGAAYLTSKKAQRDAGTALASRARRVVAGLYDRLSARADRARKRPARELPVQGGPLLLDAAFLVPRTRASAFCAAAVREARALERDGYRLTVSGPWPPYSFIQD